MGFSSELVPHLHPEEVNCARTRLVHVRQPMLTFQTKWETTREAPKGGASVVHLFSGRLHSFFAPLFPVRRRAASRRREKHFRASGGEGELHFSDEEDEASSFRVFVPP